jgi:hypothetical protein
MRNQGKGSKSAPGIWQPKRPWKNNAQGMAYGAEIIAIWKHQIPSTKYQINSNVLNSNIKTEKV